jgi:hypothetical protein
MKLMVKYSLYKLYWFALKQKESVTPKFVFTCYVSILMFLHFVTIIIFLKELNVFVLNLTDYSFYLLMLFYALVVYLLLVKNDKIEAIRQEFEGKEIKNKIWLEVIFYSYLIFAFAELILVMYVVKLIKEYVF